MATSLLSTSPQKAKKNGYATFDGASSLQEHDAPVPPKATYANASWLSRLMFGYARPVLDTGSKRQLDNEDLWVLEGENRSSVVYAKFKRTYLQCDKQVIKAMALTFGPQFLWCGLGSLVKAACAVFAPVVLRHVIDAFSAPEMDMETLALWIGAFFASRLMIAFTEAHVNFNTEIALLQLTVSMKSLIFEKAMRLNIQSKNESGMVEVSNLYTADMDNLMWAGYKVNSVWIMPIQVAVVMYMLYDVLDLAAFAGLGVIALSMFFNYLVAKGYMDAYNVIMTCKDSRMKAVKEVFGAIQIVKLNAWEDKFLERIRTWRKKETDAISKYLYLLAVWIFLFWSSPLFVSITSFATYALILGKELTAAKVFTAMVLFNAIRDPLSEFPEALQELLQARIALARVSTYLRAEEIHPDRLSRDVENYDDDVVISVEDATFKWKPKPKKNDDTDEGEDSSSDKATKQLLEGVESPKEDVVVLKDVNLKVRRGDFVIVHGAVGAGKSSLCAALLGELPRTEGKVFVRSESVAYYAQEAWIQNMSIRDNILFGLPYDAKKYDRVLDACGLQKDVAMFPAGDGTEIGQKGVNLSGGQKARVSLARACYADADVYVLDSPLAAVDAVVQSEIFKKCLCDLLEQKTVILVTHIHDIIESEAANVKVHIVAGKVTATYSERKQSRKNFASVPVPGEEGVGAGLLDVVIDGDQKKSSTASGTLIEEEDRVDGRVSMDVFKAYFNALGGMKTAIFYAAILTSWQSCQVASDLWLSHWTGAKPGSETLASVEFNLSVYALLGFGTAMFVLVRAVIMARVGVTAARYLFDEMTKSLLHAPLRFFDANPIGRILNRYSEDISTIDFHLPFSFFGILVTTAINTFQILTTVYVVKWTGLFIIPLGYIYFNIGVFYLSTSREVARLMKTSTSPVLSHLAQSEEGVATLRAFGQSQVNRAIQGNFDLNDKNNRVWYAQTVVNAWFGIRAQMIGCSIVILVVSTLVILREYLSPGLVGLSFMYAVNIDTELSWWVKIWSELETVMVSPERVLEYVGIQSEGHSGDEVVVSTDAGKEWPQRGSIAFENVKFAYKPGADLVLKGLSFHVQHNEKIGIVGRTGAGKSSLTMALFRINELESGRIVIDGVDISTINLQTLRSHLSIIPQVPVLFKGSMRAYMDPFEEYSDAEIWVAFEKVSLKEMVGALDGKLDHELSENGENFSVGERQMLCLARALLRQSRIVVMDEATASIDRATEKKLQEMIQREFVDATVLTIAHRLATVLESDRIMVLSDGRVAEFDTPKQLAHIEGGVFRELAQEGGYLSELVG